MSVNNLKKKNLCSNSTLAIHLNIQHHFEENRQAMNWTNWRSRVLIPNHLDQNRPWHICFKILIQILNIWFDYFEIFYLLTVAGLTCIKVSTSNTTRMLGVRLIRSPFDRQRTLLSSSTVFKFSTQNVSTGPSSRQNCHRGTLSALSYVFN